MNRTVPNPTKLAILDALSYIDMPLSAPEMTSLLGDPEQDMACISYHLGSLVEKKALGAIRVPGRDERSYFLP
jgi:hypothetical protein